MVTPSAPALIALAVKFIMGYVLVFNWALVSQFIVEAFTNGPSTLIGALTGGSSTYSSLGAVAEKVLDAAGKGYDADGIVNSLVAGTTILLTGLFAVLYAFFLIMISKIGLSILLALAPLFGILYLFKGTSRMVETWFQQMMNFALLSVLTILVLSLLTSLYDQALKLIPEDSDELTMGKCLALILIGSGSFLTMKQTTSLANSIAGGVAMQTYGAYSQALRQSKQTIVGASKQLGRGFAKGYAGARSRLTNRGKVSRA